MPRVRATTVQRSIGFTPVIETNARADGSWDVVTDKGTIHADIVVNAAGLWGREVAKLAGFELPLMTMEHQYFVTETIDEIAALGASSALDRRPRQRVLHAPRGPRPAGRRL